MLLVMAVAHAIAFALREVWSVAPCVQVMFHRTRAEVMARPLLPPLAYQVTQVVLGVSWAWPKADPCPPELHHLTLKLLPRTPRDGQRRREQELGLMMLQSQMKPLICRRPMAPHQHLVSSPELKHAPFRRQHAPLHIVCLCKDSLYWHAKTCLAPNHTHLPHLTA